MLKLGINHVSNEEYHSDKTYFSSTNFKLLLKDPAEFHDKIILGNRGVNHSPVFDEGSYVHSLILEPEMIEKEYAFYPGMRKQGKDWEKFRDEHVGRTILSEAQKMRCQKYFRQYKDLPEAQALIQGGLSEHTVCGILSGIPVKTRCDYINVDEGYIVDVKTSAFPVDADSFKLTMDRYRYDLSAALYTQIVSDYYDKNFDFYFIAIGKRCDSCEVFKMSQKTMDKGLKMIVEAINVYKKCMREDRWDSTVKTIGKVKNSDYEILEV